MIITHTLFPASSPSSCLLELGANGKQMLRDAAEALVNGGFRHLCVPLTVTSPLCFRISSPWASPIFLPLQCPSRAQSNPSVSECPRALCSSVSIPRRTSPFSLQNSLRQPFFPPWIPHILKEPELFLFLTVESKTFQDSWASAGHSIAFVDRWTLGLAELDRDSGWRGPGGEDTRLPPL